MRKIILIVHTSLDGFVAGPKGELDGFSAGKENLEFVCQLTNDADAALFGRVSYQLLNDYWPTAKDLPNASSEEIAYSIWYNSAQKIIVSGSLTKTGAANTTIINENIIAEIEKLKQLPGKSIIIFGSPSIAQLLIRHSLIDTFWIFINPVLFGKGISLFTEQDSKTQLTLISSKQFPNGEVAIEYKKENT